MFRLLPAALARDQSWAMHEAAACFAGMPDWDIRLLAELEPQRQVGCSLTACRGSMC